VTHLSIRFQIGAACCFFILIGLAVIPYAGIQNDEALFAAPLYEVNSKDFCFIAFHHQIPLMVMTYIGTLKTLIYIPILKFFGGNIWSVRLPMVLIGTLTVFFFFKLLLRTAGPTAATIGGLLLATDPIFLLTNTIDWGPVALGHFFLVTGCLLLLRFAQDVRHLMGNLALGCFLLGLGLWNKALFLWVLGGLAAGTLLVFPLEVKRLATRRNLIVAIVAFLFGASPFVMYNVRRPNATIGQNAHFDSWRVALQKIPPLEVTVDGSGLLGFFTIENGPDAHPKPLVSRHGRFAQWAQDRFGEHRQTGMLYGLGIALLLVPWWWRFRAAWFAVVFLLTVWTLMAFTRDAGGSVHHCVLLWPFPELFLGVTFAALPWRRIALLAGAVLVAMNLLVLNRYILDFERNGAANNFTDALFPLSLAIADPGDPPNPQTEQPIYVVDWGMLNTLALTHQGRLMLRVGDPPFMTDHPSPDDRRSIDYMLNDRTGIFVGHVPGREANTGVGKRLEREVAAAGYRKETIQTISDSNGRPVFEIFRVR